MWSPADIESWKAEIKPLSIHKTPTLREACAYFHKHMLVADIVCPLGDKLSISAGHFFPLVCRKVPGSDSKGMVHAAKSLSDAFEMIERGEADVKDVSGCDYQRMNDLPLFLDVMATPHLVGRKDTNKRVYVKRYESPAPRARIKVAVLYLTPAGLRPASFYTTELDVAWLNQNAPDILWKKNEG